MKRSDILIVLQGIGIAAQIINAGIGTVTHDPGTVLMVGGIVAGYQFIIQHLGNQTDPKVDSGSVPESIQNPKE